VLSARFEKRARLSSRADFRNVFEQPKRSADAYFTVLTRSNELGFPRLGMVISRKSAQTAVARNRIKRVIRESFRQHQQGLGSTDCIVIARENLEKYENAIFFESLKRHWVRLREQCVSS
jgi:ribonuclease P protein component